ncbi:acetate--CoA ligase family protein [Mangrovicoccus sp. HB161399]|uniref:acetate--CoA ligase family protein n=1 Tax=Mangrovicoccus sp. HB161399 TaxID=2720392 RepID=UPI0015562161|nr:acetate--CoA ligase family protein [Mangrovicoccus sp. HB161399]
MQPLSRLFSPRAVAVIGGGAWCEAVVARCRATGFAGPIWPVHPKKETVGGLPAVRSLSELPGVPDAAFIGVNREATIGVAAELSAMGCSGAVCFANGYAEAVAELPDGPELQARLVEAAGPMRILGPNCYGFVNALDGVALWPDMHGLSPLSSGVAVVGQSSNVLINLTMQRRGLPLAVVAGAGNQAQASMAEIGLGLLEDPRITALGLHVEGFSDLPAFERLSRRAAELGKPVVLLKVGRSEQAQAAAVSHTASLSGSDAGARALAARLGFAQVDSAAELVEALKLAHVTGRLASARIASASCSGGEASLMADLGAAKGVAFPSLTPAQRAGLAEALGPRVALANPLDYNTHCWGDEAALEAAFTALAGADLALCCVVLDYPRSDLFDAPDWDKVVHAAIAAHRSNGAPMAVVSLLPEGLPEDVAARLVAAGVAPLCGMAEALAAVRAMADAGAAPSAAGLLVPGLVANAPRLLAEAEAKAVLARAGIAVPQSARSPSAAEAEAAAGTIGFPVVLKGEGIAHKTEAGAVALNLASGEAVRRAAEAMPVASFLVEEMITGTVAELLVGVVRDPVHGFVLTLGLGGILTELMADTVSMLVPAPEDEIRAGLDRLKIAPLLGGYRGKPGADLASVVAAVMAVQGFVAEHADRLEEIEINPLICTPGRAVAADALIRMGDME